MKEFDPIPLPKEQIEIINQREIEKQKKLFSSFTKHNGHKVWEINCTTGEVNEAEYDKEYIVFVPTMCLLTGAITGSTSKKRRDIIAKENCAYIPSLNKKNALTKFMTYAKQNAKLK